MAKCSVDRIQVMSISHLYDTIMFPKIKHTLETFSYIDRQKLILKTRKLESDAIISLLLDNYFL